LATGATAAQVALKNSLVEVREMSNVEDKMRNKDVFMQAAIDEALLGLSEGGIPIGAVIVHNGSIIGRGHNRRVQQGSAILHGEMDALENAGRLPAQVYRESVLYTTLSPCPMCSGAISLYGVPKVVVGENRTFMGEEEWLRSRGVQVEVQQDHQCIQLMTDFIAAKPTLWNEDIGV
jgi:creatinine deaminase